MGKENVGSEPSEEINTWVLSVDVRGIERSKVVCVSLLLRKKKENVVNIKNQSSRAREINLKEGEDKLCNFKKRYTSGGKKLNSGAMEWET